MPTEFLSPGLTIALTAYAIGVASPGPSNMAIMATAMSQGRQYALALAAGVVCGSVAWGLLAAFGLSSLIRTYSWSLAALKVLGGLYLLFLAFKAAHAALKAHPPELIARNRGVGAWRSFADGVVMHLTNPKPIFVWISIVALATPSTPGRNHALGVVASCSVIGSAVFFGYALAFSTAIARTVYDKAHRWFNAILSAVFVVAGVRLLLSRSAI